MSEDENKHSRVVSSWESFVTKARSNNRPVDEYGCDGKNTIYIPPQAIKGRSGSGAGKQFSGYFDRNTQKIRFDSTDDHAFWLEIDARELLKLVANPGQVSMLDRWSAGC